MYCVIGEKILRCEVVEKLEENSWCKIGSTTKNKSVANTKLFKSEEEARSFLKKRKYENAVKESKIVDEVHACKALYDAFFNETGIVVRVIDRRFKVKEVESQLAHLRKKYEKSEDAGKGTPKAPKDSRTYSTRSSNTFSMRESDPTEARGFNKDAHKSSGKSFGKKPVKKFDKSAGNNLHEGSSKRPKKGPVSNFSKHMNKNRNKTSYK